MASTLPDEWILDHASGAAPMAVRVLVGCAAELNPEIRKTVEMAEQIGHSVFTEESWRGAVPEPVENDVAWTAARRNDPVYPQALAQFGFEAGKAPWRSRLGGVQGRKINRLSEPGVDARLLNIQPGSSIPHHDHGGEELTLVLAGGFRDDAGSYHRGDVCYGEAGIEHRPVGLPGEPCICFAVSLGGYKFRNPLMSVAARLIT
ncbi:cupin domain-containing protein [Hyphobacterium sp.]|uniref:cupin domain-containing protein n=1 Tax=Hyphobacterium sp. TaxID=2004662 RepID=UPI003BAC7B9F